METDVNVDGDDGFKGPLDPTVMSILLAMSRGCQVYFGSGMVRAGRTDTSDLMSHCQQAWFVLP